MWAQYVPWHFYAEDVERSRLAALSHSETIDQKQQQEQEQDESAA